MSGADQSLIPVAPVAVAGITAHDADATRAASASGIDVRQIDSLADIDQLRGVMNSIWGPEVVPPRNLLRAIDLAGSVLLIALRKESVVGFALGFLGWHSGIHFHSHEVGVVESERSQGVGYALKLAQRATCLNHGITRMRWTYDPLLAANARFNLVKLGAEIIGFVPDLYGRRTDAFNAGDITDRVVVSWRLDQPLGGHELEPGSEASLIEETAAGVVRSRHMPAYGVGVPIPDDYHQLRRNDPVAARAWRTAVQRSFVDVFASGRFAVVGFSAQGYSIGLLKETSLEA